MKLRKKMFLQWGLALVGSCCFCLYVTPVNAGYVTVKATHGPEIPNCNVLVSSAITISNAPDNVVVTGINVQISGYHFSPKDLEIALKRDGNSSLGQLLWNREGSSFCDGGAWIYSKYISGITTFNGYKVNATWREWAVDHVCCSAWCDSQNPCPYAEGWTPAWEMTIFYEVDSDGDGIPDNADADDDGDGMPDIWETTYGLNLNSNDADEDKDGDGLTNLEEYHIGSRPDKADTDSDGMPDGWEIANWLWPTDPLDAAWDQDDDDLISIQEFTWKTDPNKADTDGDGIPDGFEARYPNILHPLKSYDAAVDFDGDALTNLQEYQYHTEPGNRDTDGDGLPDGWEVQYGFNPLSPPNLPLSAKDGVSDSDFDGLTAMDEYNRGTNPLDNDTDSDLMSDGWEVSNTLNPLVYDSHLDPDSDGRNNLVEYQQGTNPRVREYVITVTVGSNGSVTPSSTWVIYGESKTFTLTPQIGYHIASVTGCGGTLLGNTYTTGAIIGNCTVSATFAINTYTVTPSAGANGSISPAMPQSVTHESTTAFTVTPNSGYHIASVAGCGGTLSGNTYTTGAITGNCTVSASFTDITPPTGTITINGGAAYTNSTSVTLTQSCSDASGCAQMQFSNDNATWSVPVSYATTTNGTLSSGDGTKTVYAKLQDNAGNWSTAFSASITLDTIAPTGTISVNGGAIYATSTAVTLNLTATDANGVSQMQFSNDNVIWSTPEAYEASKAWTLTDGDGAKTVYAKFKDAAGNWSTAYSDTIILDTALPTGTITINGGAGTTTSAAVTLSLACSDANGCSQMQLSNDNVTWSTPQAYATSKSWTLTAGNGEKTVYVRFNDAAGNSSIAYSDTIIASYTYTITVLSGAGGTISPSGILTVNDGASQTFTITPDANYAITDVLVDGSSVGAISTYALANITANHTITAAFGPLSDWAVTPASLSFGNVLLFRTRTLSETMNNAGAADLIVSNVQIVGANAAMFQVTNWTGARTIAPGASSSLSIVFRPTSRGLKSAMLRITTDDLDTPIVEVPLSGYGI